MLKIIRSKKYIIYLRNIYFIIDENVIFIEKKKKRINKKKRKLIIHLFHMALIYRISICKMFFNILLSLENKMIFLIRILNIHFYID